MADPTITVTNLGDQGVESVFGVIYPPQVALVGLRASVDRAPVGGRAGCSACGPSSPPRWRPTTARATATAAGCFLAALARLLQEPEGL